MKYIFSIVFIFTFQIQATAKWEAAVAFFDFSSESDLANEISQHQNDLLQIQKLKNRNFKLHQKTFIQFNKSEWNQFLKRAYTQPESKKILILYGHGNAFHGFANLSLKAWNELLPEVDILWLQSCYMANIESIYQWRNHFNYFIGSQETEFSTGRSFLNLGASLATDLSAEKMAMLLAKQYIVSYSYSAQGLSRFEREESGATIAVVEKEALLNTTQYFKKSWQNIKAKMNEIKINDQTRKMKSIINRFAAMENKNLVDIGLFSYLMEEQDLIDLFSLNEHHRSRNYQIEHGEISHLMDYRIIQTNQSDNPVLLNGYHLKQSTKTLRYTGLSILNPFEDFQTLQYRNLDFINDTGWGQ